MIRIALLVILFAPISCLAGICPKGYQDGDSKVNTINRVKYQNQEFICDNTEYSYSGQSGLSGNHIKCGPQVLMHSDRDGETEEFVTLLQSSSGKYYDFRGRSDANNYSKSTFYTNGNNGYIISQRGYEHTQTNDQVNFSLIKIRDSAWRTECLKISF